MTDREQWAPYNHGTGARMWFLWRKPSEYHWSASGKLIRYASHATAKAAADRLNAGGR